VADFSEQRFGCTAAQCNEAVDFVSTGWDLGGRVNFREAGMVPWVSLGGLFALDPGVRHGRSDADFATRGTMRTRYIIADVGLVLTF